MLIQQGLTTLVRQRQSLLQMFIHSKWIDQYVNARTLDLDSFYSVSPMPMLST